MDFSWMAWTKPTAIFFAVIAALIVSMGVWERLVPGGAPKRGLLRITTTRGDRLFISLLGAAFIHLGWLFVSDKHLWGATVVSVVYAAIVFRFI
jgi:predicted small integral membrane protein